MSAVRKRRWIKVLLLAIGGFIFLCLVGVILSAWSNRDLLETTHDDERLTFRDEAVMQEILHLKDTLGESIWPGWGEANIPMLLFNDSHAFLARHPAPPPEWEAVESLDGGWIYHRLPLRQMDSEPQNFTEEIGGQWSGSLATPGKSAAYLVDGLRQAMPDPLAAIFPFKVAIRLMLPTDQIVAAALHENFHAYQALVAPGRFTDAELAYPDGDRYWAADTAMHEAWQAEMDLLVQALQAKSDAEAVSFAGQFLEQRRQRRQEYQLAPALVTFEQRMEWLEGLAMYVEFSSWRTADSSATYQPVPDITDHPGFHNYRTFERHWSQQLDEMKRQATQSNDIRFYFSGMAQAVLLDRLANDWQARLLSENVWIEALLNEAVQEP